jgi:hypothetical protein
MGPVQVLVVGFEQPAFSGEVLAEFARLREAGIVRLVDLLLVSRGADGTLETLAAPDELGPELGGLAAALLGRPADGPGDRPAAAGDQPGEAGDAAAATSDQPGEAGDPPAAAGDQPGEAGGGWSLADAVPAGSAAAVALIEHIWAGPLTAALRRAGGSALEETWLAPADVAELEDLIARRGG